MTRATTEQLQHLAALLAAMTPAQRAAFVTVQTAIRDGLISPDEQRDAVTTARLGGEKWEALLADLRLRSRRAAGRGEAQ